MTAMQSTISSETPAAALHVRPRLLAGCAGLLVLGASVFVVPGFGGAQAASSVSWEQGCAYRHPSGTFGNGTSIDADYCNRLRFCQSMSDQGRDAAPMGCMGFEPSLRAPVRRS